MAATNGSLALPIFSMELMACRFYVLVGYLRDGDQKFETKQR
jgi:hypothetical protein